MAAISSSKQYMPQPAKIDYLALAKTCDTLTTFAVPYYEVLASCILFAKSWPPKQKIWPAQHNTSTVMIVAMPISATHLQTTAMQRVRVERHLVLDCEAQKVNAPDQGSSRWLGLAL
jgi:hypothetical protein